MMRTSLPVWIVLAVLCVDSGRSAPGPVASGPGWVAPGKVYTVDLSGGLAAGVWTINWGDGQKTRTPASDRTVSHIYDESGVYPVGVTFAGMAGGAVTVRPDYPGLVRAESPLLYLGFDDVKAAEAVYAERGEFARVSSANPALGVALGFDGKSYLDLPGQKMTAGDFFGLEFWLKAEGAEGRQAVFSGGGNAPGNVQVYVEKGALCFELSGSGVKSVPMREALTDGGWHQFGVSYERSRYYKEDNVVRFYRDGLLFGEQSYAAQQSRAVDYTGATIGARRGRGGDGDGFFKGCLDEVVLHRLGIFPGGFLARRKAADAGGCSWPVAVGTDGAEAFTVDEPVVAQEVLVPLDPDPEADSLPVLQAAVNKAAPGTRLKIINAKTGRSGGLFQLRSHDVKWRLLTIANKTDLEIDGGGAGFVVRHAATKYLTVTGCTRVALHDMSFDIDQTQDRPGVYARVERVDPESGLLGLQYVQGNPLRPDIVPAGMKHWRWRSVDTATRKINADGFLPIDVKAKSADPSDASRWAFTLSLPPSAKVWKTLAGMADGRSLLQINNAHFGGSGVSLYEDCRHITFERVNFYGVMGMAFLSSGFDYLRVSHCTVGLPPGLSAEDRPFSACSDGFHFHGADAGHVIFEYNDIAMTDDDPVSIKDGVYRNVAKTAERDVSVAGIKRGEVVELRTLNLEPLTPEFTAAVVSVDEGAKTVRLDKPVPGETGGKFHLLNTSRKTVDWVLRGNHFHDLNGRLMIYTPSGTATGNRVDGLYFHLGFSAADFDNAGRVHDVVLAGNLFLDGHGDTSVWGARPSVPVFSDVALIGNSLVGSRWKFNATDGVLLVGNYVERSPSGGDDAAFRAASHSRGVRAVDNVQYRSRGAVLIANDASSDAPVEQGTVVVP